MNLTIKDQDEEKDGLMLCNVNSPLICMIDKAPRFAQIFLRRLVSVNQDDEKTFLEGLVIATN